MSGCLLGTLSVRVSAFDLGLLIWGLLVQGGGTESALVASVLDKGGLVH